MYGQEKKRHPRNTAQMLDLTHIVIGIVVVICAIFAFVNPDSNSFLFPIIFWLAAILYAVNGWVKVQAGKRDRKKQFSGICLCAVAVILLVVGILSAVSVWR